MITSYVFWGIWFLSGLLTFFIMRAADKYGPSKSEDFHEQAGFEISYYYYTKGQEIKVLFFCLIFGLLSLIFGFFAHIDWRANLKTWQESGSRKNTLSFWNLWQ